MRLLLASLLICFSGCASSTFEKRKETLERDIELLRLEVRKQRLVNILEKLDIN